MNPYIYVPWFTVKTMDTAVGREKFALCIESRFFYQSLEYSQNGMFQDIVNSINCQMLLEFSYIEAFCRSLTAYISYQRDTTLNSK